MFNFNRVLFITFNAESAEAEPNYYEIVSATRCNDHYDKDPNGCNRFEIDLEPIEPEEKPIYGITMVVGNCGDWVQVQKNLNPQAEQEIKPYHSKLEMSEAIIERNLLIVTGVKA